MSFRYYLGKVSKAKREKIKAYSLKELEEVVKDDCVRPYDIAKEVYGLGSDFDYRPLKPFMEKFFTNLATHRRMATGDDFFWVLSEEGLAKIIDLYHDQIEDFMTKESNKIERLIAGNLDPLETERLQNSLKSRCKEWTERKKYKYRPYSLDKKKELVGSWKYEYAIFQLVYLYRSFDFKKNHLVIYGY